MIRDTSAQDQTISQRSQPQWRRWLWPAVATVVVREGRLLMVEEHAHGKLVLNQPAGHLEPDESLYEAALRETREETGWDVQLTAFVGAYQWKAPDSDKGPGRHYLRFAFAAEPLAHDPARPLDDGIVQALWMTPSRSRRKSGFE